VGVADNPQETVRELRELVVAYAKQETVDPLKGLLRYLGLGIAGSILIGFGYVFVAIGALRLLEGESDGRHFNGNMSWAPYAIVFGGTVILATLVWMTAGRRRSRAAKKP
jgi:formate/nitrite transporter FocA (FNT family)